MRYSGVDAVVASHERPLSIVKVMHGVDDIGAVVETLEYWDGKGSWHDAGKEDQQFFATVLESGDIVVRLRADALMTKRGAGVKKRVYDVGVVTGDKIQVGSSVYTIAEIHDATYYTGVLTIRASKVQAGG